MLPHVFDPQECVCVCSVLAGFTLESHFPTQLAPQQINPPLPESAEIQGPVCVSFRF
jgi:hypothetical protein